MEPSICGAIEHTGRGLSHVKFKVRYNALILNEFTVADMVQATGLNPESIRTELQRLRREGFLESRPLQGKHNKRGGRPSIYQLTDGLESRRALSESIEAFYPPEPSRDHPTSQHYVWASHVLDQLEDLDDQSYQSPGQLNQVLDEVERDLEIAEITEGEDLVTESAKAFFRYERARLSYHRGDWEEAKKILEETRSVFEDIGDAVMVRRIDEFHLWGEACQMFNSLCTKDEVDTLSVRAQCLVTAAEAADYETDSLLVKHLLYIVRGLSRDRRNESAPNTPSAREKASAEIHNRVERKGALLPNLYQRFHREIAPSFDCDTLIARGQWVRPAAFVDASGLDLKPAIFTSIQPAYPSTLP